MINDKLYTVAVVFAGGTGTRMHSKDVPKQFLVVHGKPVIVHTVEVFQKHAQIDSIVISCVKGWELYCKKLMDEYGLTKVSAVVPGGDTGQMSILNGLVAAEDDASKHSNDRCIVLIHDGVRPLINDEMITNAIDSVIRFGSAITCAPANETIVLVNSNNELKEIIPRESARLARAPQAFYLDEVLEVQRDAVARGVTNSIDTATLMRSYGKQLHLIDGSPENIKITTPGDFFAMRAILDSKENSQLYDVGE